MKRKILMLVFIAFIVITGLSFLVALNKYGNIVKIELEFPKDSTKNLTITDNKQISSLLKSIKSADKVDGIIIINEKLKNATKKVTIYYKNNTVQSIRLLLGDKDSTSMYYYENDLITGYNLSAEETKKIHQLIIDLQNSK